MWIVWLSNFLTIDQELRRQTKFDLRQICGVKFLVSVGRGWLFEVLYEDVCLMSERVTVNFLRQWGITKCLNGNEDWKFWCTGPKLTIAHKLRWEGINNSKFSVVNVNYEISFSISAQLEHYFKLSLMGL